MKKYILQMVPVLIFTAFLLCTGCSKAEAVAATMRLAKTEGIVEISGSEGEEIDPADNLNLYSGYDMRTKTASYAWINLDDAKLAKMDEESRGMIGKEGKDLVILMNSGNLFFHVKEPLKEDETMGIRTSTMTVGIRGTCGWVERESKTHSRVYILEGKVTITDSKEDKTENVSAGQTADVLIGENGEAEITVSEFTVRDIPEFVLEELTGDEKLPEEIRDASGLDILNLPEEPDAAPDTEENKEEANEQARRAYQEVLDEYIEAGGLTENERIALFTDPESFREKYPNASASVAHYGAGRSFYSTYYDIDGNGVDELLIGAEYEESGIVPVSLFAYHDAEVRLVYGDRENVISSRTFSVMNDRTILGTKSGGGDYVDVSLWKMNEDGYTLENIFNDTWSYSVDGANGVDYNEFEQERLEGRTKIEISGWQLLVEGTLGQ